MADDSDSSSSHQSSSSSRDPPNPPEHNPEAADFAQHQKSTASPGMDLPFTPSHTGQSRHVGLPESSAAAVENHGQGTAVTAPQVDQDSHESNDQISSLPDIASEIPQMPSLSFRVSRGTQTITTGGTHQQYQQSQTISRTDSHPGNQSGPVDQGVTKSHAIAGSPAGKRKPAKKHPWNDYTDSFIYSKGEIVRQNRGYRWLDVENDFKEQGFGFEAGFLALSARYQFLKRNYIVVKNYY